MPNGNKMRKVHSQIIKQVGLLGLIAIKKEIGASKFYKEIKSDNMGFKAQNLIFHNLLMIKDFAQYN